MNRHIEAFLKNKDHFKLVPNLKGLRINVCVSVNSFQILGRFVKGNLSHISTLAKGTCRL